MKEQLIIQKPSRHHEHDNRELVNLDFYENEIRIMEHKLVEVLANHSTKKIKNKVDNLNHQLNLQKLNLEEFRKNYDVKEMFYSSKLSIKREKLKNKAAADCTKNDESFFQHLQSFENTFKQVRRAVFEFISSTNQ